MVTATVTTVQARTTDATTNSNVATAVSKLTLLHFSKALLDEKAFKALLYFTDYIETGNMPKNRPV